MKKPIKKKDRINVRASEDELKMLDRVTKKFSKEFKTTISRRQIIWMGVAALDMDDSPLAEYIIC